jgi:hypothetical protein
MVLDIDSELVRDPNLWIVHGERYRPIPDSPDQLAAKLEDAASKAKELEEIVSSAKERLKTDSEDQVAAKLEDAASKAKELERVASSAREGSKRLLPASEPTTSSTDRKYSLQELKQLALVARYFNMFDYIHASLVERKDSPRRRFWRLWRKDRVLEEEWTAWQKYMEDFFRENKFAVSEWERFNTCGIYPESFKKFIDHKILKKVERPGTEKAS